MNKELKDYLEKSFGGIRKKHDQIHNPDILVLQVFFPGREHFDKVIRILSSMYGSEDLGTREIGRAHV